MRGYKNMLKVNIKTSYSEETFIIPDWDEENDTDYYGFEFFTVEGYAEFCIKADLAFPDSFEIVKISAASREDILKLKGR